MPKIFKSADSRQINLISKFRKIFTLSGKLNLKLGGVLNNIEVAFEDYGKLNAEKSNTILICHAISGDSHVAKHSKSLILHFHQSSRNAGKILKGLCLRVYGMRTCCASTTAELFVQST